MDEQARSGLAALLRGRPLAIAPSALEALLAGTYAVRSEAPPASLGNGVSGRAVAVIPIYGPLQPRPGLLSAFGFGTALSTVGQTIRDAARRASVSAVLLDVDSPGGMVDGTPELAALIRQVRRDKPVIAVADTLMASAAYWIASQADEVIAAPSSQVGSVGVITSHDDISGALELRGIKTTVITAGKHKGEALPYGPLSAEAKGHLQGQVDAMYAQFTEDVALGRHVGLSAVRAGYGQGRLLLARDALAGGMVDRIGTLDDAIARALTGDIRRDGTHAFAPARFRAEHARRLAARAGR